jgi:hypothetical protein
LKVRNGTTAIPRRVMLAMLALVLICVVGCQATPTNDADFIRELDRWVERDSFKPSAGHVAPIAHSPPNYLYQYAEQKYATDGRVRSLLAYYFLRFEAKAIEINALDVDEEDGGLLSILYNNPPFGQESSSTSLMRQKIEQNQDWFCLDDRGRRQLRINIENFRHLIEKQKMIAPR